MAEEAKKTEIATAAAVASPVTPAVVSEAEKKPEKDASVSETETKGVDEDEKKITQQVSFREETNVVGDLPESQRKALEDLKSLILEACAKRQFSAPPPTPTPSAPAPVKEEEKKAEEEVAETKTTEEEKLASPPPTPTKTTGVTSTTEVTPAVEQVSTPPPAPSTAVVAETAAKKEETATPAKTEVSQKTEEVKKEPIVEKTVEAIKETILEVATTSVAAATKAAATAAAAVSVPDAPPPATAAEPVLPEEPIEPEQVSIYGIPLLADERSDVILLKFLRARDFKVKEAYNMIRNTVRWRKEFNVDDVLEQDLGNQFEKVLFTHGYDKEGRLVCYNVFGEFENKELYQNTFGDAEKREKFFKWLIQFIEKIVRDLNFSPTGVNSIVLVNDLKSFPGYGTKRDVSKIIDKFLVILQDNYPEFVAKQLCINTSWWYVAYYWIYLTVFTPRSKSKFVFASPSKTPDTLFKYIAPEQVPVQYGGHSKSGENLFTSADAITEVTIAPHSIHPIEFTFSQATEVTWELRVIGWDVTYGAEFVPEKEGAYTLNISKPKKVSSSDEPVISDTFKVTEPGKVVITVDNQSSKKKKLLYRSKVKA
ncbi:hypothetical protein RND81_01G211200 [Saponaria officinalis]|uniref:Patellin-3 n=1 Tax=Saponaria officinalis TaxID=3572 RepID=A0AAW1NGG6_SAPOF